MASYTPVALCNGMQKYFFQTVLQICKSFKIHSLFSSAPHLMPKGDIFKTNSAFRCLLYCLKASSVLDCFVTLSVKKKPCICI